MAVLADKEPDRTGNSLAFMITITKVSIKYSWPSRVVYDQHFRQEAADNGLKDWAKVDPSIYTQCFMNVAVIDDKWCKKCQSIDHGTTICPLRGLLLQERVRWTTFSAYKEGGTTTQFTPDMRVIESFQWGLQVW